MSDPGAPIPGSRNKTELIGIQIMRGIAASLVVLHHSLEESLASSSPPQSPDWLTTLGACGVDIFFVISGFIMLHTSFPQSKPAISPIDFFVRRLSRIYPFYWFCLLATLSLWSVGFYQKLDPNFWTNVRAFLLLPTDRPVIGVSWTLIYEMYFYCIFAVALLLKSRLASICLTSGAIILLLVSTIELIGPDAFLGNPIVLEFCFGMVLAYAFGQGQIPNFVLRYGWILGALMLCLASFYVKHHTTNGLPASDRWWAWGLPAVLLVTSSLGLVASRGRFLQSLVLVGDASYAIYLTHPFVMIAYAKLLHDRPRLVELPQLPFVPLVFMIAIVGGIIAHRLVERPLIALVRKCTMSVSRSSQVSKEAK
jgi:exopolysaccharide production protein ExoZ